MPTAAVFDEFLKIHPKAKVILTVRDSPEEWVKSFKATIMQMYHLPHWFVWVNQLCGGPVGHISNKMRNSGKTRQSTGRGPVKSYYSVFQSMFKTIIEKGNSVAETKIKIPMGNCFMDDKILIQLYTNWIKYVKETVPKDQLLIFNAKDGVDKIAEFLGRKTPNWKLPHMNGEIFITKYPYTILIYPRVGLTLIFIKPRYTNHLSSLSLNQGSWFILRGRGYPEIAQKVSQLGVLTHDAGTLTSIFRAKIKEKPSQNYMHIFWHVTFAPSMAFWASSGPYFHHKCTMQNFKFC